MASYDTWHDTLMVRLSRTRRYRCFTTVVVISTHGVSAYINVSYAATKTSATRHLRMSLTAAHRIMDIGTRHVNWQANGVVTAAMLPATIIPSSVSRLSYAGALRRFAGHVASIRRNIRIISGAVGAFYGYV